MALLTKQDILKSAESIKTRRIEVPELDGEVIISVMSGKAKDMFEKSINGKKGIDMDNIRAKLVAATVVDENGNLLFTEQDVEELGKVSCAALDRMVLVAQELNIVSDDDVNKLAKNS